MKLTEFETQTAIWQRISTEVEEQLRVARIRNDCDMDERTTAKLRGEIRVYKEILGWAEPNPPITGD